MAHMRMKSVVAVLAVLGLFAASCELPCAYYRGAYLEEGVSPDGWGLAALGWTLILMVGWPALGWFANPLLALGLIYLWQGRCAAAKAAALATSLSLLPLALLILKWNSDFRISPDVAVVLTRKLDPEVRVLLELRAGYFCWVATHALLLGLACVCWYRGRKPGFDAGLLSRDGSCSSAAKI